MPASCPICNHRVSSISLLTKSALICAYCDRELRVSPRSSFLLSVFSFAVGALTYSMLHRFGLTNWLSYFYGFSATVICIFLLRPVVLRMREIEKKQDE